MINTTISTSELEFVEGSRLLSRGLTVLRLISFLKLTGDMCTTKGDSGYEHGLTLILNPVLRRGSRFCSRIILL
jgi:hypothetical protein